jgi:hypothetical protein
MSPVIRNNRKKRNPSNTNELASTATLLDFRNQIQDLARPNLFQVTLQFPSLDGESAIGGNQKGKRARRGGNNQMSARSTFLVKAANLPASTIGVVEVPFRGRQLKIAGDRTFEPWTVTIMNEETMQLRETLEAWANHMQQNQYNYQSADSINDYQARATVDHLDRQGESNGSYSFEGIWPSNISAIDLAWDSNDTAEEYTVEFQVQYWEKTNDSNMSHGKRRNNRRNRNKRGRGQRQN